MDQCHGWIRHRDVNHIFLLIIIIRDALKKKLKINKQDQYKSSSLNTYD